MPGTIVVGVTEKPVSRRAVDWACDRAIARGLRIELISIVGGAIGVVGEGHVVDEALRRTSDLLEGEVARVRERGATADGRVRRGRPVEQLIAASEEAAMLVIGSDYRGHGTGPERGQHGLRITAGAHCPVAVVPDVDLAERTGVVVGVDGSEVSEAALAFAAEEADRLGEPLTAVSTWTPIALPYEMDGYPTSYLESMKHITEETLAIALAGLAENHPDLQVHRVVEYGFPASVINRLAAHARMAVVGSHGRGAIGRFLLGSTSELVLSRLATTTVVVRPEKTP